MKLAIAVAISTLIASDAVHAETDELLSEAVTESAIGAVIGGVATGTLVGLASYGSVLVLAGQGVVENIDSSVVAGVMVGSTAIGAIVGIGVGALVGADGVGGVSPSLIAGALAVPGMVPGGFIIAYGIETASDAGYGTVCTVGAGFCVSGIGAVACGALGAGATVHVFEHGDDGSDEREGDGDGPQVKKVAYDEGADEDTVAALNGVRF